MPRSIDADFTIDRGRLSVPDQQTYVAQRAAQHLRFLHGESFLYPSLGLNYYQDLFVGPMAPELAAQVLIDSLLNAIPEITNVETLEIELPRETRRLRIRFQVSTIYGDFELATETL